MWCLSYSCFCKLLHNLRMNMLADDCCASPVIFLCAVPFLHCDSIVMFHAGRNLLTVNRLVQHRLLCEIRFQIRATYSSRFKEKFARRNVTNFRSSQSSVASNDKRFADLFTNLSVQGLVA